MLCLLAAMPSLTGGYSAGLVDELDNLTTASRVASVASTSATVHVPRGSIAGVHVLVEGLKASEPVRLEGGPRGGRWFRLIDVPVEVNTGLGERTEKLDGRTNPHVIARAPFRVYDALQPIGSGPMAQAGTNAFRYEFVVPASARPGVRRVRLRVGQGEWVQELTFRVEVAEAVVPPIGRTTMGFTNWWSPGNVAAYHDAPLWSERFWSVLDRYADLMARARQNTILVPWADFVTREGETFRLDRAKLRRFVEMFERRGIVWLEGGHFAARENNDWMARRFSLNLTGTPVNTPQGERELASIAGELMRAIREEGWSDRWLQHIADEPIDVNVEDYAKASAQVRRLMPGIPIFEATMSRSLVGAVQAWCPQVHHFQEAAPWFEERKAAGDQVWVYTCLAPGGPWMNRLLDMERLRPALIPWALVRFNLDGFLHWGLNYWGADPFRQSVVPHGDPSNPAMFLPAGDTHVAYPGGDDVWSSTRLEAHRIGFEDAELLRELRRRDPALAERILARVVRGFDDFTKSPSEYRAARAELLKALGPVGPRNTSGGSRR